MVVGACFLYPFPTAPHPTDPHPAGESGLGKTTLINTLFATELSPPKNYSRRHVKQLDKLTEVDIVKAELEEKQFKVKLTVIDTPGFGDYVNNRDSWAPIVDFIDDQHEAYMRQEQQPQRGAKTDLRVHACLYFIRPTGHTCVGVHRAGKKMLKMSTQAQAAGH
jgi:cell division control protein 12